MFQHLFASHKWKVSHLKLNLLHKHKWKQGRSVRLCFLKNFCLRSSSPVFSYLFICSSDGTFPAVFLDYSSEAFFTFGNGAIL